MFDEAVEICLIDVNNLLVGLWQCPVQTVLVDLLLDRRDAKLGLACHLCV
jgi:hypothetical protein